MYIRISLSPGASMPTAATPGSAAYDLRAYLPDREPVVIAPDANTLIPTGIRLGLPHGWFAFVLPRSGLALHYHATITNSPGLIDSDYRGDIGVIIDNQSRDWLTIRHGDRIAQLLILPVPETVLVEGDLEPTSRGDNGFGSTGTH